MIWREMSWEEYVGVFHVFVQVLILLKKHRHGLLGVKNKVIFPL